MLMEGVNVLSQQTVRSDGAIGLLVTVGVVAFIISLIMIISKDPAIQFLGVFIILLSALCMATALRQPAPYTEYKVTIDKSVKLEEFNNKYKITNQEGKIYTIQKK